MPSVRSDQAFPKIAIVSDRMVQCGGAERIVEAIPEAFPDAPVFTLLYDPARGPRSIERSMTQSWLANIPGALKIAKALVPLYPSSIESFDLRGYDVIISSHLLTESLKAHIIGALAAKLAGVLCEKHYNCECLRAA